VELFFIISGFLAEYTFHEKDIFINWIYRRIQRIFPYAFIACVFSILNAIVYYVLTRKSLFNLSYDIPQIITSLTLTHAGWIIEYTPAINNPTWYLCIMIICFIVYFGLKQFAKNDKFIVIICSFLVSLTAAILYVDYHTEIKRIPFLRPSNCRGYSAFFEGVMIGVVLDQFKRKTDYIIYTIIPLAIVSTLGIVKRGWSDYYLLVYFIYPAVVFFSVLVPQIQSRIVRSLSAISFEVYLWHVPIYGVILTIFSIINVEVHHTYFTMITFTVLVWIVATVLYFMVEKPLAVGFHKRSKS